jgi:hypothetical protein
MDVLAAAAMGSEQTTAATVPTAAPAPMETASPTGSKRPTTGGRETKAKAPKKVLTKEKKVVEAAKQQGRRKNLKERKDATTVAHQVRVAAQLAWDMQAKANTQVGLPLGLAEAMLYIKQERIFGVTPPVLSVSSVSSHMCPGTPSACAQVHAASRFASGAAPV